jgi:uncharacterized Fe-S cluster-containing radical SAM superfamily protein
MKASLFGLKKEIIDTLIANNEDFRAIVEGLDPKDFADIASTTWTARCSRQSARRT